MSNSGCVSLRLPFGMEVGGSALATPTLTYDPMRGMLSQFAGVLAPLMPIFKIIGFAKDITDALKAIPDCITQLSPKPLVDKLAKVVSDIDELLGVLPPLSVPKMVQDLCGAMITFLTGIQSQIAGLQAAASFSATLEVEAENLLSTDPDAAGELTMIVAAQIGDTTTIVASLDAQSCSFNTLAGAIKNICELVGLPAPPLLPCFGGASIGSAVELLSALNVILTAIDDIIALLTAVAEAVGGATTPALPC